MPRGIGIYTPIYTRMTITRLDDLLTEWALRSPDGLASGHKSVENVGVLLSILREHGLSETDAQQLVSDVINDGTTAEEPVEGSAKKQPDTVMLSLSKTKRVRREFVDKFRPILDKHPELLDIYDSIETLDAALTVYNTGQWNGQNYRDAFAEIDRQITHKGLGRGELVLVYIIKGCVSGGAKSGDLELSDGTTVDVKEIDESGEILVMMNSIDNYQNLNFVKALQKLKTFLESEPEAVDILVRAYQTNSAEASTEPPILDSGLDESTLSEKVDPVLAFLDNRNVFEMGNSVFTGLSKIRDGLNKMSSGRRVPDTVTFRIGDEKKILLLDQSEVQALRNIVDKLSGTFTKISFQAAGFDDRTSQYLVPILKSLDIFAVGNNAITVQTIHEELIKALHYDGIVFVTHRGSSMEYVPKSKMENFSSSPVKFSRLSKGVKFKVSI